MSEPTRSSLAHRFTCLFCAAVLPQVDALGRQLARGAADGEEASAHRENLLAELASAQQVGVSQTRGRVPGEVAAPAMCVAPLSAA